jgi:hypothetical protein
MYRNVLLVCFHHTLIMFLENKCEVLKIILDKVVLKSMLSKKFLVHKKVAVNFHFPAHKLEVNVDRQTLWLLWNQLLIYEFALHSRALEEVILHSCWFQRPHSLMQLDLRPLEHQNCGSKLYLGYGCLYFAVLSWKCRLWDGLSPNPRRATALS